MLSALKSYAIALSYGLLGGLVGLVVGVGFAIFAVFLMGGV